MTAGTSGEKPARGISAFAQAFVVFVACLAAGLLAVGWWLTGGPYDWGALLVLLTLGVFSWVVRDPDIGTRVQISLTSVILLASAVIVGPVGAGLVGAASTALVPRRAPLRVRVFNMAMISVIGSVGGLVYLAAGGARDLSGLDGAIDIVSWVGLPLIAADVAQCLVNAVLLAGIMRVYNGIPMRAQLVKLLSTTGPAYIGYGIIGFLFVVLWIPAGVGWFSAVLVLAPLAVAQWAFRQYGDEVRAHERTLDALVASVEAKDPASVGHSARVAKLCEWMADALGLGFREAQEVRTAGMLHDLGTLAIPSRVLRLPRERNEAEQQVMAEHPVHAVDMLGDIEFVKGSLPAIAHHHERYDGRGYPFGLAGEAIPLAARIIAVADAFDALTTARSYRPALTPEKAMQELHRRAGTHLDPHVVSALARALTRHTWSVTERSVELLTVAGANRDHDDPECSDDYAERADLRARLARTAEQHLPAEAQP
ncbi:HD-GYP domain-containing protein [Knoellia sp. 3-2P3]|uniref:HD-GYP domain-containing protein n=1 Tax=unclassified Knoellia TaxID=2618719 RepID=UPI0023DB35F0|nr:HD-GYP domain-containing protein [Knoellia sp. 3-2P3]MDF2093525.1 HD-GYP domain-containing protein [Knoellia sp. 3-2P3]